MIHVCHFYLKDTVEIITMIYTKLSIKINIDMRKFETVLENLTHVNKKTAVMLIIIGIG